MPTPAQVVQYAALAEVYAANAIAKGNLFSPYTDPRLARMINMERKALAWKYSYDPTNTTDLVAVANYVWAITGKFGLMAQATITLGGSSVTPGTGSVVFPIYVTITSSSLPLSNGQSSATLTSFIGFNLTFIRNGVPQTTLTTESTYFTWSISTGLFTCSPAATTDEVFSLIPV